MIDTQPYLDEIRRLLIETLWANPCDRSELWLSQLYPSKSVAEVFSYKLVGDPRDLIRESYTWARNARYKRKPTLVDVTRLRFYSIPNRMYEDELRLTGEKHVDGRANIIVRPIAQVAATVAGWAIVDSSVLSQDERNGWAKLMWQVSGDSYGK